MSLNWMRHFELQLLDDSGKGIVLSDFKVTFEIEWWNISSESRVGTFKIFNVSAATAKRIIGSDFSRVKVIAGYDGIAPDVDASQVGVPTEVPLGQENQLTGENIGMIFSGEIRYAVTGKASPVDSYVLIQACDTDRAFTETISAQTIAAGYTAQDLSDALMQGFSANGATEGRNPEKMPTTVFPRGRVLFGMSRHLMDNVATQCNATWQFVDGKRVMMSKDEYAHDAIVLNSETGLIGMPQQTIGQGLNVRCLINPNIRMNGLIQIDQASVLKAKLPGSDISMSGGRITEQNINGNVTTSGSIAQPASIATDGVYFVRGIMYTGDTRGPAWYMDMLCEARGAADLGTKDAYNKGL